MKNSAKNNILRATGALALAAFVGISGASISQAAIAGGGAPSGGSVSNAVAVDDFGSGLPGQTIHFDNLLANDKASKTVDKDGVETQETWVASKTIFVDLSNGNNKATVDANGKGTLTTPNGVLTFSVDPSNPAAISGDFAPVAGYAGAPIRYIPMDTAAAIGNADIHVGVVGAMVTVKDDIATVEAGVSTCIPLTLNDTPALGSSLNLDSVKLVSQTGASGKTLTTQGGTHKLVTVEATADVPSYVCDYYTPSATVLSTGNPQISYMVTDANGSTGMATISIAVNAPAPAETPAPVTPAPELNEPPLDTPAPGVPAPAETPAPVVPAPVVTPETPAVEISTPVSDTAVGTISPVTNAGTSAVKEDALAETAAKAPANNGGIFAGAAALMGGLLFALRKKLVKN